MNLVASPALPPVSAASPALVGRLVDAGLLRSEDGDWRTTRRWQAAMMRTLGRLMREGKGAEGDLREPVVHLLVQWFPEASNDELVAMTTVMLRVELEESGAVQAA